LWISDTESGRHKDTEYDLRDTVSEMLESSKTFPRRLELDEEVDDEEFEVEDRVRVQIIFQVLW